MAIIEIAKIQVRRGQENQTGMPQLDGGEFGWAVDTQRLYIGNGTVAEGSPASGNTEIFTEHNFQNLFSLPNYWYEGNTGDGVQTGPLGAGHTLRSYKQKLDDIVSIADFGVDGNKLKTLTDNGVPVYQQIQWAIDEIYGQSRTPQSRKTLYFPAGTYVVTGTIYVPPYAHLLGDGFNRTVFQANSSTSSLSSKSVFQFVGTSSTNGVYSVFPNVTSNHEPREIILEDMEFDFNPTLNKNYVEPLIKADYATDCQIVRCKFRGTGTFTTLLSSSDQYIGIEIRGVGAITSENLTIKDSIFYALHHGIKSDYDIKDTVITNNSFVNLFRGITYYQNPVYAERVGPYRSKILYNKFKDIQQEGIYVGSNGHGTTYPYSTNHVSAFNSFSNVGNNRLGDGSGVTSIINFQTNGNSSTEDRFERDNYLADVDTSNYISPIAGRVSYTPNTVFTATISATYGYPTVLTRFPYDGNNQVITIDYARSYAPLDRARKGQLVIRASGSLASGSTATIVDTYTYSGYDDGGISFIADLNTSSNTIKLLYQSTDNFGLLEYRYNYMK
jgi:hypothetical protein